MQDLTPALRVSLAHATTIIRGWHREYNEERPKKELSGLTPADYAAQMAAEAAI
ncbi:transposase [Salinisphaera sp. T5B8]